MNVCLWINVIQSANATDHNNDYCILEILIIPDYPEAQIIWMPNPNRHCLMYHCSETTSHVTGLGLGLVQLEADDRWSKPRPRPIEFGLETEARPRSLASLISLNSVIGNVRDFNIGNQYRAVFRKQWKTGVCLCRPTVEVDGDVDNTWMLMVVDQRLTISSVFYTSRLNRRWTRTITPVHASASRKTLSTGAEYCDERVCLSVCLWVCIGSYLWNHILYLDFIKHSVHVVCDRPPFWPHCNTLCISGFVDDVMFSYNGPRCAVVHE